MKGWVIAGCLPKKIVFSNSSQTFCLNQLLSRSPCGWALSSTFSCCSQRTQHLFFAPLFFASPRKRIALFVSITPEQYCFFTIHTIFHDISIWCNISRYFHDIFQALNWSKKCVISSKCCPGSIHVEILQQKRRILCFCDKNDQIYAFLQKKIAPLKV